MTIGIIVSKCRAEIMQGRNKELVRLRLKCQTHWNTMAVCILTKMKC